VLILLRHAMPAYEEFVPPNEWPLSEAGHAAARALELPPNPYLAASDEPKAWQTLEPFGPVVRDARFGEVRRENEPWDGPYHELRRAYVDGSDHVGWEARAAVVARFDEAVAEHSVLASGRPLVVASHGMAMTVWLTARTGLPSPGAFWESLRFPDVLAVGLAARTVVPLRRDLE